MLSFRFKAGKYRWGCLAITWCIFIILAASAVFGSTSLVRCSVFPFVLAADTFFCLSILKTLRKQPPGEKTTTTKENKPKNMSGQVQGDMEERREREARSKTKVKRERHSMKKEALVTIVIIQCVLTLNYVPFILAMAVKEQLPHQTHKCQIITLALAAASCCTYLLPLLYLRNLGKLPFTKPRNM